MGDSTFITTSVYSQRQLLSSSSIQSSPSDIFSDQIKGKTILIWLDAHYSETDPDYQISLKELQHVASDVYPFIDCDAGIDFLTEITNDEKKVILIVGGMFAKEVVPLIEDWPQLEDILVFRNDFHKYNEWSKHHPKVKGVVTGIHSLIECPEQIIAPNFFTMINTIGPSNIDPNRLNSSFMYSQLLKEILLELHAEEMSDRNSFIEYYREHSSDKAIVDKFEHNYNEFSPIYWYSACPFMYDTVNRALRTLDIDLLLRMIFFIGDLQKQIEQLYSNSQKTERFVVYRGQGTTRDVSQLYADTNNYAPGCNGVLFEIEINPEIPSSPFASIKEHSQFSSEDEILFSTHTVFYIDRVTVDDDGLYYVNLRLTNNYDNDLCELTIHRRKEIEGRTAVHRLAHLLYRMGKFNKAKEIYQGLLGIVPNDEILYINHYLARVDCQMGRFDQAISRQAVSLQFDDLRNPSLTAAVYAGMGEGFLRQNMLEPSLEFYEKASQIADRSQAVDDHSKVLYLNNIGLVLKQLNRYDEARDYFEKALDVAVTRFPPTHPDLASLYQNIGSLFFDKGDFDTSIEYLKKSLVINQLSLPSDHPSLGMIHYNLSHTFNALRQSNEAIHHGQLALDILKKTLQDDHCDVRDARAHLDAISVIQRLTRSSNILQQMTTHSFLKES